MTLDTQLLLVLVNSLVLFSPLTEMICTFSLDLMAIDEDLCNGAEGVEGGEPNTITESLNL